MVSILSGYAAIVCVLDKRSARPTGGRGRNLPDFWSWFRVPTLVGITRELNACYLCRRAAIVILLVAVSSRPSA